MAKDQEEQLSRLKVKADLLLGRYRALVTLKARADEEIENLTVALKQRDAEVERLSREVEFLKIASTIAPDRNSLEATRLTISNLIRDIDRCISDLES